MQQYSQYLEAVYEVYASEKRGEGTVLAQRYRDFQNTISAMHFQAQDAISCAVHSLCAEYEHIAFLDGIRAGAKIMLELQDYE